VRRRFLHLRRTAMSGPTVPARLMADGGISKSAVHMAVHKARARCAVPRDRPLRPRGGSPLV